VGQLPTVDPPVTRGVDKRKREAARTSTARTAVDKIIEKLLSVRKARPGTQVSLVSPDCVRGRNGRLDAFARGAGRGGHSSPVHPSA
jgi:hypothetical protein